MPTARERAHAAVREDLLDAARRQLGEVGAAGLSLRAVAREVGLASSAVYRYFASRDQLLTALLVEAYSAASGAALRAEARVPREDLLGRWVALTRGLRRWARGHHHEWALLYGSPVPGYAAPEDTVDPALAVPRALLAVLVDAPAPRRDPGAPELPASVAADMRLIAEEFAPGLSEQQVARAVQAWTALVGAISSELFGHLAGGVTDDAAWFDHQSLALAHGLGLRA